MDAVRGRRHQQAGSGGVRQTRWRAYVAVGGIVVATLVILYGPSVNDRMHVRQESLQVARETNPAINVANDEPTLNEELLPPGLRFVPETYAQYLTSVYTWWNILDRVAAVTDSSRWIYGYMRKVQLLAYSRVVWAGVGTDALARGQNSKGVVYCEVGLNAGHGTIAMLLANPRVQVYSFDLMLFPYSPTVVHLIDSTFPGRFRVIRGDSTVSVPQHVRQVVAGKSPWCDVALVDGDHSFAGSKQDLINIAQMAKCNATLLADDINEGPGQALKEVEALGLIVLTEWNMYDKGAPENPCVRTHIGKTVNRSPRFGDLRCMEWGWAMGRFVSNCATNS